MAYGINPNEASFEQFSRYQKTVDILRILSAGKPCSILDIGSGRECLLVDMLPSCQVTCLDPALGDIADKSENIIPTDLASADLDGQVFDYVVALDLLDHLPRTERGPFIDQAGLHARHGLILACPCLEKGDARKTDLSIDQMFLEHSGEHCPELEDHFFLGLPESREIKKALTAGDWQIQESQNGHTPWLQNLLSSYLFLTRMPHFQQTTKQINSTFNKEFQPFDDVSPAYRQFFIATRNALPEQAIPLPPPEIPIETNALWSEFRTNLIAGLLDGIQQNQATHTREIKELEKELAQTREEYKDMSNWASWVQNRFGTFENSFVFRLLEKVHAFRVNGPARSARILAGKLTPAPIRTCFRKIAYRKAEQSLRKSLAKNGNRTIVVYPIIPWKLRWQRPQQLLSRLARQGYTVIYIDLGMLPKGRTYKNIDEAARDLVVAQLQPDIFNLWLHCDFGCNIYQDSLVAGNLENTLLGLTAFFKQWQIAKPLHMVQFPNWTPLAQQAKADFGGEVIFDCMDNHSGFSNTNATALEQEKDLFNQADLVVTSAQALFDRAYTANPNTILLNNGTEFEHFKQPGRNGKLDNLTNGPIIGYFGAISDWFDIDLVTFCARARKDWNFVLIGNTFGCEGKQAAKLNNIHFLNEKPYTELPGYLGYFDVCIIPFKINPLTKATNPVKFYEYISCGKPVVATPLPELVQYQQYCYLAAKPADFLTRIELALTENKNQRFTQDRIALAKNNSWDARVEQLLENRIFKQSGA